jgi:hypothetical protein
LAFFLIPIGTSDENSGGGGMSKDPIIAALARLEAGQAALRDDLQATRTSLMARIDRVQHSVDLLRDDIGVKYGGRSH